MAHRRFGALYARSFEQRPWLTLAVANGTLGVVADTLAQTLERYNRSSKVAAAADEAPSTASKIKRELTGDESATITSSSTGWDVLRSGRFFVFGVAMAPLLAEWNKFIEHRFPLRVAKAGSSAAKVSVAALAKRVAVDQIAFAPFGLVCFVGAMGVMEGRNMAELKQKFQEMYMPALLANWQVWPLVQTINFRFMPLRYRVPFTGAIGIAWQVFLSILNASRSKLEGVNGAVLVKHAS